MRPEKDAASFVIICVCFPALLQNKRGCVVSSVVHYGNLGVCVCVSEHLCGVGDFEMHPSTLTWREKLLGE